MTKTEFLQTMRQTKARTVPPALPESEENPSVTCGDSSAQGTSSGRPFRGAYNGKDCNPSVSATHCQLPYRGAYGGKERTACAAALQRAGIPADAPYYAGAFRNVEQAMENRKPASRRFWEAYLLSLCGHMERLTEHADKKQERQALHGSIQTVQAVLYALQETERTESEPRETD